HRLRSVDAAGGGRPGRRRLTLAAEHRDTGAPETGTGCRAAVHDEAVHDGFPAASAAAQSSAEPNRQTFSAYLRIHERLLHFSVSSGTDHIWKSSRSSAYMRWVNSSSTMKRVTS